jgi:hypothetical protein
MAQEFINVGTAPNDGLGDPIRTSLIKCNTNFSELFSRVQSNPPGTPTGTVGDSAGMIAFDNTYLYVCVADFDDTTEIWRRIAFVSTW